MNDIRPPARPPTPPSWQPVELLSEAIQPTQDPPKPQSSGRKKRWLKWSIAGFVMLVIILVASVVAWYQIQLKPYDSKATTKQRIEVSKGMTARSVAELLQSKHLIRSADAFYLYTYIHNQRDHIEAGVYSVAPNDSVKEVVSQLVSGKVEQLTITFLPGSTIKDVRLTTQAPAVDVTSTFERAGYSKEAITSALSKKYTSSLFAGKPSDASLEGYVYGDSYTFDVTATPSSILERTFTEFADVVKKNNLVQLYQQQGLDLYQGITLASIIQREVDSTNDSKASQDQSIVAQIFLSRLKQGIPLGSDVTYQYAAASMGVAPTPTLNSPYNTRVVTGLPPGPISNPGLGALLAVAHPASTDYLFFLSGDDGQTYFAHTDAEHQANITNHCQKKCSVN